MFGAFLDSTLRPVGDAAIFGGLAWCFVGPGDTDLLVGLALYCLVMGSVTSYAKARAESLGLPGQGRHRRAGRPAGRDPGDDRARRAFDQDLMFLMPLTLGVLAVGQHRHGGPAGRCGVRAQALAAADPRERRRRSPSSRVAGARGALSTRGLRRRLARWCGCCPSAAAHARVRPDRRRDGPPPRRARASASCAPTCTRDGSRPTRTLDDADPRGGAVLPALLVRVVPAARLGRRRTSSAHRASVGEEHLRDAARAGSRGRRGPAAHRQLGLGRRLGVRAPGCRSTTVAERLRAGARSTTVRGLPRRARHGDPAADRGPPPMPTARASGVRDGPAGAACSPTATSPRTGVAVEPPRRAGQDAPRPGAARPRHRRGAGAGRRALPRRRAGR